MTLGRSDFLKLAACATLGEAVSARAVRAADEKLVRVLEVPTDGAKSVLYAQKNNLFRKRGINADIVSMGSGAAIFAAVLGGSADVGSGSLFPVYAAYSRGVPLRIIAPASLYLSSHADAFLLVKKDSPIQSARDLNGKIIGGDATNDVSVTSTRVWMDQRGGDGKTLRSVELKQPEQLGALDAGRIDAVVLKPPYLTTAMDSGKFRKIGTPLDAIAPRFLLSCWVATADYIAKNKDTVDAFVAGLTEASRFTNANQAATLDLVAGFTGQDAAVLSRGIRSTTAETVALADFQKPLDFGFKNGIIDKTFDLSGLLASCVPLSRTPIPR
jgi:NitT/TauT family transport system substrate-binding protein